MAGFGLEALIPKKKVVSDNSEISERTETQAETKQTIATDSVFPKKTPFFRRHFRQSDLIFHIEVEKIKPNPYQPRRDFNEEGLNELSQSIREFGIIQPLVVSKVVKESEAGTQVEYQLVAGERRLMAAKIAGLERVPAIIKRIASERDKLELALIENVQRSNLNPIEAAKAYSRLQDEFNLTQREIAARIGKSREVIANTLRLLNLPLNIQEAILWGKLTESQARELLAISDIKKRDEVFQTIVRGKEKGAARQVADDPEKIYWERQLEEKLGAPVKVIKQGDRGKMVIQFFSKEEWREILKKLLGEDSEISG